MLLYLMDMIIEEKNNKLFPKLKKMEKFKKWT